MLDSDTEATPIKEVAKYMIEQLVDFKKDINIKNVESDGVLVIEVIVNNKDVGKVVGKGGATVGSIRTYLNCIAARQNRRLTFQVTGQAV